MPVDKSKNNVYIWYSGATNVTGEKLVEALGVTGGRSKPAAAKTCMVIGWGAKTKEKVSLGKIPTLNHPDNIRINRNKLEALKLMQKAGVSVAPFTDDINSIGKAKSKVVLPVIGRTKFHQGGKGFWHCPTMTHVKAAVAEKAAYFQNLIEIVDEFRLHVVGGKCIYAVKKVKRTVKEMEEAYIKHEMDRQKQLAEKNGNPFDEATAKLFLDRQAKKFAQDGANMLIRSNRLGWKFARVKTVDKKLEAEAVKSLKAIGLDFGAVDCCIDAAGKPFIIEVNTGPGLEETPFAAWVAALEEQIGDVLKPKTLMSKLTGSSKKTAEKTAEVNAAPGLAKAGSKKTKLAERLKMAQEMVEVADEEDTATLNKVFKRMFGE